MKRITFLVVSTFFCTLVFAQSKVAVFNLADKGSTNYVGVGWCFSNEASNNLEIESGENAGVPKAKMRYDNGKSDLWSSSSSEAYLQNMRDEPMKNDENIKMRAGHIIFGVDNLEEAVKKWRDRGFSVEYGTKSKKDNALIYFSEGPYIELLNVKAIPGSLKWIFKLFGAKPFIDRMNYLADSSMLNKDVAGLCIEKDAGNLLDEIEFLKKRDVTGFYMKKCKRNDPKGNKLTWKLFFPKTLRLPFLMTYFDNHDPKPKNFVHPNGAVSVKRIKLVTTENSIKILKDLVDDERIEYEIGDLKAQVVDIEYKYDK